MKRVAEQTDYAASVNNSWRGRRCHRTGYLRRQFGLAPGNDPCLMLADDLSLVSAHIFITYSSQGLGFSILCFEFVLSIHWAKKITMLGSAGLVGVLCKFAPIIFPRCHDLVKRYTDTNEIHNLYAFISGFSSAFFDSCCSSF